MKTTVFLGDSHTHGYYADKEKVYHWHNNNYAEIYANEFNKFCAIYAQQGASNRKYPGWLATLLEKYNNITEVFVQNTYWHRFHNASLTGNNIECPINNFCTLHSLDDYVAKYYDKETVNDYTEKSVQIPESLIKKEFYNTKSESYYTVKIFNELCTHLQYKDYCLDLLAIDYLCKTNNIKWYCFRMADKVVFPENYNLYQKINPIIAPITVETYFRNKGVNVDNFLIDDEHYNYDYHKMIAMEYIPWLRTL